MFPDGEDAFRTPHLLERASFVWSATAAAGWRQLYLSERRAAGPNDASAYELPKHFESVGLLQAIYLHGLVSDGLGT